MLARVYPNRFSVVELFNCTMQFRAEPENFILWGTDTENNLTSIHTAAGQPVRMSELTRFDQPISPIRDWPFFRNYNGKCDNVGGEHWRPDLVAQMRWSDAQGTGLHFYWDLRGHGLDQWTDHWVDASTLDTLRQQTQRDDVQNLSRYRNDQSYPAFFNLQNYASHGDPGPGEIGGKLNACTLNLNNGDDHGTWGGYFDWDTTSLADTSTHWAGTFWLVGPPASSGYAAVDESPNESLTADVALRRPQNFKPVTGTRLAWQLTRTTDHAVLQSGETVVGSEGLVAVPGLHIPKDPQRVRLAITPRSSTITPAFLTQLILPGEVNPAVDPSFNTANLLVLATNVPPLGKLLLFLPGSGSSAFGAEEWLRTGAAQGYHAIGLKYQNDPSMASVCTVNTNLDCFGELAEETVTGLFYPDTLVDAPKQVRRVDSIEVRLQNLLTYQSTNAPAWQSWSQFLDGGGNVRWEKIAVSGHSQGGSCALFLAKSREVSRAVLFATVDWIRFPVNQQPPWFLESSVTPPDRIYGFTHLRDSLETDASGTLIWQQLPIWQDLQLTQFGAVTLVESNAPPYLGSHTLTSLVRPGATNDNGSLKYHNCLVDDNALPRTPSGEIVWTPVWTYMLTNGAPPTVRVDFGDAPASYGTALAQNGARHRILPTLRLGSRIDPENDGQPGANANTDDTTALDDDDGVILTGVPVRGTNVNVRLTVTAPASGAYVDAFVDFNGDGDFADPGEKIFDRRFVTNGVNTLHFAVPSTARLGKTYSRLRLSSAGGLGFDGPAADGEVEDFVLAILPDYPSVDGSGIDFVPQDGTALRRTADGTTELLNSSGNPRVALLPGENVVSRRAGRMVTQLQPPVPLGSAVEFQAGDDIVLRVAGHYQQPDGSGSELEFTMKRGPVTQGVAENVLFFDEADALFGKLRLAWGEAPIRICAFDDVHGHVGSEFTEPGRLGILRGSGNLIALGWAASPTSFWLVLDQSAMLQLSGNRLLTGNTFRFVVPEMGNDVGVAFRGLTVETGNPAGSLLGLKATTVRNPESPQITGARFASDAAGPSLEFQGMDDVFFRVDSLDELDLRTWKRGAIYHLGRGTAARLPAPTNAGTQRFYRIVAE